MVVYVCVNILLIMVHLVLHNDLWTVNPNVLQTIELKQYQLMS